MLNGNVTRIAVTLSLLSLFIIKTYSQENHNRPVQLMFYNVENLFDIKDDTLTDDGEFTPSGLRRWNATRYFNKVQSLSKVILAAGEDGPPGIIGLCEVENRRVLEDIVFGTNLARFNFGIVHEDSHDPRGIDVCMIYRNDLLRLLNFRYLVPEGVPYNQFRTRSVLYAEFVSGSDSLHIFLNHWPSKRGGVLAGEELREKIAAMVRNMADSLLDCSDGRDLIIIAGDFNASPDDKVISVLTGSDNDIRHYINLSGKLDPATGTYKYKGVWEMMDQVLVSPSVLERHNCRDTCSLRIFSPPFLLQDDPAYPGKRPFPTYTGFKYSGGFSDHLPVILELSCK